MTNLTRAPDWLISKPIAHRAFHDKDAGRPENSIAAFSAALEAGFAIECDLQVSKTGEPVVYHDPVLGRMTGHQGNVHDYTPGELAKFKLLDSNNSIQTLAEHLAHVAGRTPLILELKAFEGFNIEYVDAVAGLVNSYDGPVCVKSFNHQICAQFKPTMPTIPRGLTAKGGDDCFQEHLDAMVEYDLQFASYNVVDLPNRFADKMRKDGIPVITWTVRNEEARETAFAHADQMIFEGFDPRELTDGG